jgi:hypothetical protein
VPASPAAVERGAVTCVCKLFLLIFAQEIRDISLIDKVIVHDYT